MKRFFKSFVSVFIAVLMTASLMIIPSSAAPSISKTSITVTKGYSSTLSVSGTTKTVTWSTGDKSIATVTSKGKVVGKGVGSTYIYAKVSGTTLKCKVKVVASKISTSTSNVVLDEAGDTKTVTVTVKGSHKVSVGTTNKKVATVAFVKPATWDDDKIKIKITAKGAGTAKIKVYHPDYKSSIYKNIDVTVDEDEISLGNSGSSGNSTSNTNTMQIVAYTNNVEVAQNGTYNLQVYSSSPSRLTYSLTNSNIATVTAGTVTNTYYKNYTIKGVTPGTTTLRFYDSNNNKTYYDVKITVGGSTYYEMYPTAPTKLLSTDQIIKIEVDSRTTYYMLVPDKYDPAYVNRLVALKINSYSYYTVYDSQPARMAQGDTYYDFYHNNSKYSYGKRYILLPKDHDKAKLNTAVANYNEFYDYYTVYNESPKKQDSWDQIESWTVNDSYNGKPINRYMLVPYNTYDNDRVKQIIEDDKEANNIYKYYTPYTSYPRSVGNSDKVIMYSKAGTTRYMVVPRDNSGIVKANDAIYKDTGVYEYNVRYSTNINPGEGEAIAVAQSGRTLLYILYKTANNYTDEMAVNDSANNYADGIKDN